MCVVCGCVLFYCPFDFAFKWIYCLLAILNIQIQIQIQTLICHVMVLTCLGFAVSTRIWKHVSSSKRLSGYGIVVKAAQRCAILRYATGCWVALAQQSAFPRAAVQWGGRRVLFLKSQAIESLLLSRGAGRAPKSCPCNPAYRWHHPGWQRVPG